MIVFDRVPLDGDALKRELAARIAVDALYGTGLQGPAQAAGGSGNRGHQFLRDAGVGGGFAVGVGLRYGRAAGGDGAGGSYGDVCGAEEGVCESGGGGLRGTSACHRYRCAAETGGGGASRGRRRSWFLTELGFDGGPGVTDDFAGRGLDEAAGDSFEEAAELADFGGPVDTAAGFVGLEGERGLHVAGAADAFAEAE